MRGVRDAAPLSDEEAAALFAPATGFAKIVLAVSGGPDSTAMMGLFAAWRQAHAGPVGIVATVDHGLRAPSHAEAVAVGVQAQALGMAHVLLTWQGDKPLTGVQEAAREARYRLLDACCRAHGAGAILLAHTLDDQAETVLMRLARGSGLKGLAGMRAEAKPGDVVRMRPFLHLAKARMVATCAARGWPFVVDPSNTNDTFLRPRLRQLMPQLAAEGLSAERLVLLARRAARADDALDRVVDRIFGEHLAASMTGNLPLSVFAERGAEIAIRLLDRMIRRAAPAGARAPGLENIEALAERLLSAISSGEAFHATLCGVKITRLGGVLQFSAAPPRRPR